MSDTFKLFLFTERIFTNSTALEIAYLYQFMSAIGYVIENIQPTPSDELFYTRWVSLSKYVYRDLVNVDKGIVTKFDNYNKYKTLIRSILMDYSPSNELTEFIVYKLKQFFNEQSV